MGKLLQFERTKKEENYNNGVAQKDNRPLRERIVEINTSLDRIQAIMQQMREENERSNVSTHSKG